MKSEKLECLRCVYMVVELREFDDMHFVQPVRQRSVADGLGATFVPSLAYTVSLESIVDV